MCVGLQVPMHVQRSEEASDPSVLELQGWRAGLSG